MKTTKILFSFLLIALAFTSCSEDDEAIGPVAEPVADFSFETASSNPQLVSFINKSEDANEFIWDFGDGSEVATQKHPTHMYEVAGVYTVILTAVNGEASTEASQELIVVGVPTASFNYTTDEANPLTLHFDNLSQNVSEYSWDFGDGTGTSTEENPSYTYPAVGTYLVSLTASGEGGTVETSLEVEVLPAQPAFDALYIVGDASPSGWNIGTPEEFSQSSEDPFIFTYEGLLTPGNLKFSTFTGDWCDGPWLNAPAATQAIADVSGYIVTQGCDGPDNQWVVTEETQGRYRIVVDMREESISFEKLTAPYSELYAIGDAAPNGWVPQTPKEGFTQNPADPFVFTYEAYLNAGELKIATFTGEWCDGDWLNASDADQPVSDAEYIITTGCDGPDNKWRISEEAKGDYLIRVDLYNETISFEKQ